MASLDGTQLFEDKDSDCWIYIWMILNLAPDISLAFSLGDSFRTPINRRFWTRSWSLGSTISQHCKTKDSKSGTQLETQYSDLTSTSFSQPLMDLDLFIGTDLLGIVVRTGVACIAVLRDDTRSLAPTTIQPYYVQSMHITIAINPISPHSQFLQPETKDIWTT